MSAAERKRRQRESAVAGPTVAAAEPVEFQEQGGDQTSATSAVTHHVNFTDPTGTPDRLERQAAAALGDNVLTSMELSELAAEIAGAIVDADEAASAARALSADPVACSDPRAELDRAQAAEICATRLRNLAGRLQQRHAAVHAQEERAALTEEGADLDAKAANLAATIAERVPELIATLSNLFSWARAVDSEITAHNMRRAALSFRQGGDSASMPALAGIEQRARPGLPGSVLVGTRLVAFEDAGRQVWPPPTPLVDMDFIQRLDEQLRAMPSGWALTEARGEAAAKDSQIAGAYFDRLNSQTEAREAAEARGEPQRDSVADWRQANMPGVLGPL